MIRKIKLYGHLKEEFGGEHTYNINSVAEGVRALQSNYPKFVSKLKEGYYAIVRGEDLEKGDNLTKEEIQMNFSKGDFHIVPVVEGGKSSWFSIIFGAILIVLSFVPGLQGLAIPGLKLTFGGLALTMGIGMVLSGVAQLLNPMPTMPDILNRESPEERPSFIFNGPVNVAEQGGPVPIVYGEFIVGSTIISAAIDVVEV